MRKMLDLVEHPKLAQDSGTLNNPLTFCMPKYFMIFLSAANFSKINSQKILSEILSDGQTVWKQIRPDIMLGLIWFQTVCKLLRLIADDYTSRYRVKKYYNLAVSQKEIWHSFITRQQESF